MKSFEVSTETPKCKKSYFKCFRMKLSLRAYFKQKSPFLKRENHFLRVLLHTTQSHCVILMDFVSVFAVFPQRNS